MPQQPALCERFTHIFSRTMPLAWEAPAWSSKDAISTGGNSSSNCMQCCPAYSGLGSSCLHPEPAQEHNIMFGHTCEGLLPLRAQVALLVVLVCPPLVTAVDLELTPSSHTTCLTASINKRIELCPGPETRRSYSVSSNHHHRRHSPHVGVLI